MGFILRVGMAVILLIAIIIPLISLFNQEFSGAFQFTAFTSSLQNFITILSSFFRNVKGVINYLLYLGSGRVGITVYNTLIKIGLLFPVIGLTHRLRMSILNYIL